MISRELYVKKRKKYIYTHEVQIVTDFVHHDTRILIGVAGINAGVTVDIRIGVPIAVDMVVTSGKEEKYVIEGSRESQWRRL